MNSQMQKLTGLTADNEMNVIAITSGKGGVGKTNIAVNLAVSLARQGQEVVLFDGDLGLANVDIALGLKPRYDIRHVLSGERHLEEVLLEGPHGIRVVPASSGISGMTRLSSSERASIIRAFSDLERRVDTLIVDTGAGIDGSVLTFCSACQAVVVVICDEPSSITDAYALIKVLNKECGVHQFQLLANMVESDAHGRSLYAKLSRVASRFLDVSLGYVGAVPRDIYMRKAVQQQGAVVDLYPRSDCAKALTRLADKIDSSVTPGQGMGRLGFFVERLIHGSDNRMGAI